MMRRRIWLWIGLGVLFTSLALCGNVLAKETYTVQKGDSLYEIAAKTGVTPDALKAANRLKGNRLRINQTLVIPVSGSEKTGAAKSSPSPSEKTQIAKSSPAKNEKRAAAKSSPAPRGEIYAVKKGDTLAGISRKTGVSVAEIRELNRIRGNALKVGQKLALKKKGSDPAESVEPIELSANAIEPGLEEEEEDDLSPEEAQAQIERRKQDSEALMGKWSSPDEQKLLVKVALGFLGAPYRLGGSSVTGIDCSAFVKKIYQFFNVDLPRTAFEQYHVGMRVARNDLEEGDLIFFKTRKTIGHVGIYIGNNQFVHAASRKKGVRVDTLSTPYYDRRFVRAVRLKGSDDGL